MSAASVLSDMFAENHRTELVRGLLGKQKAPNTGPPPHPADAADTAARPTADTPAAAPHPKFSLDRFLEHRAELGGYFKGGVDLPYDIGSGEHVFGTGWDPARKVLHIVDELPDTSERTAVEICRAAQYAAIARDDPRDAPPTDSLTAKVIATYVAWEYATTCLDPATCVAPYLMLCEDQVLFARWPELATDERVAALASGYARWDDPATTSAKLRGLGPVLGSVRELVPTAGEATPLVPAAYRTADVLRQRILRAAVDGHTDRAIQGAQKQSLKRLQRRGGTEDSGVVALLEPYFGPEEAVTCVEVLRSDPAKVRGGALKLLLQMESAVAELSTPSMTL